MSKHNKFIEFLNTEQKKCQNYLKEKGCYNTYPKEVASDTANCYDRLGIIYKFHGDEEKARKMFGYFPTFHVHSSRLERMSEEDKTKTSRLLSKGIYQLRKGIYFNLAHENPQKATQLFEWAAENCLLPDEYIAGAIKYENYDHIAVGHLWRGYALLNLGRYEEAHELLTQVVPYLNKYKKLGIEMWRKIEYALPKALVPLCGYKLDPAPEKLQEAQSGIEDYIKSLRENKDKLEGYLYYFHLKEAFPDVYSVKKAPELPVDTSLKINKPTKKMEMPPDEYDTKGSVIVFDMKSGALEVFGTNNEFEEYVDKIKIFGDYPVLSSLMELYVTEGQQEPEPLIEECEKLLLRVDIDAALKEKTEFILAVARDAKAEDSTVMLYFDPEVE